MLADIAMYFCTFVVVTPSYYESLQVLEMPNVFTDNPDAGYIIAMPFHVCCSRNLLLLACSLPAFVWVCGKVITLELLGLGNSIYFACCYIFVVPRSCSKIKVSRAKMYFISLSYLGGKGCVKVKIMSRSNCKNRFL